MDAEMAARVTAVLWALAAIQSSAEHLAGNRTETALFAIRLILSAFLLAGVFTAWICLTLLVLSLVILVRFQGPYNGGADRMALLILFCLNVYHWAPIGLLRQMGLGYLGAQLTLCYFISGWVKIVNPDWRRGRALRDVFLFSAYPVSEDLRDWAKRPRLLAAMSWCVIGFELTFPLALVSMPSLIAALAIAAAFHLANAFLFGLNRFFWVWIAAYPSLLWLQNRLFAS